MPVICCKTHSEVHCGLQERGRRAGVENEQEGREGGREGRIVERRDGGKEGRKHTDRE